jgi:hypothetical protein
MSYIDVNFQHKNMNSNRKKTTNAKIWTIIIFIHLCCAMAITNRNTPFTEILQVHERKRKGKQLVLSSNVSLQTIATNLS